MTPFSRLDVNGGITFKECQTLDFHGRLLSTCQQEREIREDQGSGGQLCEIGTGLIGPLLEGYNKENVNKKKIMMMMKMIANQTKPSLSSSLRS